MTVAEALRSLRQPLVALCAVLLVANLVVPVASFAGGIEENAFCHGAAPASEPDGGAGPARLPDLLLLGRRRAFTGADRPARPRHPVPRDGAAPAGTAPRRGTPPRRTPDPRPARLLNETA